MWRSTFDSEILKRSIRLKQTNRTCGTIQAHSDELNWANSRTFHELNSLRLIHLMKSSTFGLGLNYCKLHLIKLYHVNSLYTSLIIWKITCKEKTLLLCYNIRQHLLRLRLNKNKLNKRPLKKTLRKSKPEFSFAHLVTHVNQHHFFAV